ncbi:MAG TPA: L-threonylcarbamoyladenylate synthase [Rhizomicrobium sp.]|jgi:L-threonylcarbamoyladenylate synthase|nr:L-threonylcarbamoyladenylate synthase [Rhizomicrobium sp.]
MPRIEPATRETVSQAAALLRSGGLIAFPTETVYGLGANAIDDSAVARIFEAKARPRFNPLIVHVRDIEHADSIAVFDALASRLAQTFWPGPLTLVLPRRFAAQISLLASAGLDTVALRVPSHPVVQNLLAESQLPLAAPSANRSGTISATRASHVAESLGESVDLVLDGGAAPLGVESTIVGFDAKGPLLLRPGALERDRIEAVIGELHDYQGDLVQSPGRLQSHYAPRAVLHLNAQNAGDAEALLAFGPTNFPRSAHIMRNLSPTGDLREAAANLFAMLHELDNTGCNSIAVMSVPDVGLGEAINDRLRRAAAPRES